MSNPYLFACHLLLSVFSCLFCSGQITNNSLSSDRGDLRIVFYNVENFFDAKDDSAYSDNEFLPDSEKQWTELKVHRKALNIFKTIAATGGNKPPEIICLAEIENMKVLRELYLNTPLQKFNYKIVHFESPDQRGIDVALLYNREAITELESGIIRIVFPYESYGTTRDILYFKALIKSEDTLHLFVNHWPSRRGGQKRSEIKRLFVAKELKMKTDSIVSFDSCANIVITGDFNDEPSDRSLSEILNTEDPEDSVICGRLYNLSTSLKAGCKCGTYKYKGTWNMFDQFIVSGNLLKTDAMITTCINCIHIADYEFLLQEDRTYGGRKPYRTYQGPLYLGGFSDHLPVYLDLYF
ncbi:MAG: endonuclease [Bacteroidales bacterium]|nr:endonuclease [Bacteroidales bacterium]